MQMILKILGLLPGKERRDTDILQNDLDNLGHWSSNWLLKFQPSKCKLVTYGKPKEQFHHDYSVNDGLDKPQLERVNSEVDLGVTFDSG